MAGALVVLAGALYAAVFAIGKIFGSPGLVKLSYLFYGVLVVAVLVLGRTLDFSGVWNWVVVVMLVGYLVAPQAIWKLCEGTHSGAHGPMNEINREHSDIAGVATGESSRSRV
jgi:hypothetical protein